jgi:F-type H+-transporting ATPase subunit delta
MLMSDPGAQAFLTRSKASFAERSAFVERSIAGADPLVINLGKLLVRKNRTALAPFIAEAFREMADVQQGVAHAKVRTAVPLDDSERQALGRRLSSLAGRSVEMQLEVDPSILGGIVARIGDEVIDGSAKGKLMALRRRLREAAR